MLLTKPFSMKRLLAVHYYPCAFLAQGFLLCALAMVPSDEVNEEQ